MICNFGNIELLRVVFTVCMKAVLLHIQKDTGTSSSFSFFVSTARCQRPSWSSQIANGVVMYLILYNFTPETKLTFHFH